MNVAIAMRNGLRFGAPKRYRTGVRRLSTALACFGLFVLAARTPARAAQGNPSEYQLKAAFVYNFAKFVDWPPKTYSNPQSPFAICILGDDPFGSLIDDALQGKTVADHPVVIRREKDATAARHCQIVFVSASEKHRLPEILEALKGANILIVGDFDGFAARGGTIELTLQDSRVRFAINPTAADDAGLRISSKLLALATIVHGTSESGKN
ncbi:MAG TPA: YfiR family protein [Candidatus Acidoferrales bacterium]|nr:YfiR family protein [Candidatus Acidoferrales bacterium]